MANFETIAVRVFKRKSDNQIVWYHELQGPVGETGEFPTTIEQDLVELPSKMPEGETPLGGAPDDYTCIEER